MRSAARSNVILRYGRSGVLRPLLPQAAPVRIAPQLIFTSSAATRRPFHASTRALWATSSGNDNGKSSSSMEAADDEEIDEQEKEMKKKTAEIEAALEEKERSDAYNRWVEAVRQELKNIEEAVRRGKRNSSVRPEDDVEQHLGNLEKIFYNSPAMASAEQQDKLITFANEPRKPNQMPYLMLDPQWYRDRTEDERLQQVLAWKPFSARSRTDEKTDQQFRDDPFSKKSPAFSGRNITEEFRHKRLEKYLNEELVNKRKVYSDLEQTDDKNLTLDQVKKEFRANLSVVESVISGESAEEVIEPEVTKADKYNKPPGFVSATDMLKFSEEKLQADLQKLMKKAKKCIFCRPAPERPVLDPMNVSLLTLFITPTGDIIGRRHNGNCRRHQRKLATTIKRAKHMGIFSHKYGGFTIYSPFHAPPNLDIEAEVVGMDSVDEYY